MGGIKGVLKFKEVLKISEDKYIKSIMVTIILKLK